MVSNILPYLQAILASANIIIIIYGGYRFLGQPRSTLENRVAILENELRALKQNVKEGDAQIEVNEQAMNVMQHCLLALIEFEIQFCISHEETISDDLKDAKKQLHEYLAKK